MNGIGSLGWRYRNYGLRRFIRYFFLDRFLRKIGLLSITYQSVDEFECIKSIAQFSGLDPSEVQEIRDLAEKFLLDLQSQLTDQFGEVKIGVVGSNGPVSRLALIGCLLKKLTPDAYIETGTQHGVSAEFALYISRKFHLKTSVISIDVDSSQIAIVNSGYTHRVLRVPCGDSFVQSLQEFATKFKKVIFVHDSDHTFEHMSWELKVARNLLAPIAVICDDVEQHRAFYNFSKKEQAQYLAISSQNHGTCAAILFGDPDGT